MKKRKSIYASPLHKRKTGQGADRHNLYAMLAGLLLALGLFSMVGWGVYTGLCHTTFFQVESIAVEGSERFSADEIVSLAGLNNKSNLVAVSKKEIATALQATGWIDKVEVQKKWPNTIVMVIHERTPVAMIQVDGVLSYMD
nr:FtsQ-type POTRA domain-containing protein [Deltaproteobacteria bacterium]